MQAMSRCFPIANDLHRVTVSEEKKKKSVWSPENKRTKRMHDRSICSSTLSTEARFLILVKYKPTKEKKVKVISNRESNKC